MWNYTDKVLDHFMNPRNVGEVENADAAGEVGSLACGDALLPEEKMHCSVMGRQALETAIANYKGEGGGKKELEGQVVCTCFGVTEGEIERAIRENGLTAVEQVTHYTKAGGGCGKCQDRIQEIIDRVAGKEAAEAPPPKEPRKKLTNIEKIKLIEDTMDAEIRPLLRADGGGIELVDVEGNGVIVQMRGTCTDCPSSPITAKELVEKKLREFVGEEIYVKEVRS